MQTAVKTTSINIRTDEETKNSFSKLCNDLGLSVSSALNMIMKSSARNKTIPIELTTVKKPVALEDMTKEEFISGILEAEDDFKNGRYMTKDEFIKYAEGL